MSQKIVIIVAGGTGSRMQSTIPKQFLEINNQAIIIKTISVFLDYDAAIKLIVCVHKDYKEYLLELINKYELKKYDITIALGGHTRFQSVKNGLDLIQDGNSVVAIHDAARPFVSVQTLENCFKTAIAKGNAVPVISMSESIRRVHNGLNSAVDRTNYRIVQTPQCFLTSKIKQAFNQEFSPLFTDDATVLESIGEQINLVDGNVENIKITTPFDFIIAKTLFKND